MGHDRVEDIHRHWEDDGAVILSRYVVQGLQISQLKKAFLTIFNIDPLY